MTERPTSYGLCGAWCAASMAPGADPGAPRWRRWGEDVCAGCKAKRDAHDARQRQHTSDDGPWAVLPDPHGRDAAARRRRAPNDAVAELGVDRLCHGRSTTYRAGTGPTSYYR